MADTIHVKVTRANPGEREVTRVKLNGRDISSKVHSISFVGRDIANTPTDFVHVNGTAYPVILTEGSYNERGPVGELIIEARTPSPLQILMGGKL